MTAAKLERDSRGWFAPCATCWQMGWVEWRSYHTKLPRFEIDKTTVHECKGRQGNDHQ